MLELFTERGRRVVALAQTLASQQQDHAMSAEHLLAALFRVDGGDIACAALGVSEVQAQLLLTPPVHDARELAVSHLIRPTPNAKRMMGDAALRAHKTNSKADVGHLLVALLLIDDAKVNEKFAVLGVDRDAAYERAYQQIADDERSQHPRLPPSENL